jgi:hypothetical protein
MSITVSERNIGRRTTTREGERAYVIKGATNESDALTALLANAPSTVNGLGLVDQKCEVEELGENLFYGIAKYEQFSYDYQPANSFHFSFDISGVNTHITHALAHVNTYPNGAATTNDQKNFQGTIGVNEDGTIDGCDIVIPALTWQMTYTFNDSDITTSFITTLMNTVGKVNTDTFHSFAAGTLLLTSVSGQQRDDKMWDLLYKFACSENETNLSVGNITGIQKKGWEYMWVYYETDKVGSYAGVSKVTRQNVYFVHKVPKQVMIEKVFKETAFSVLGI